ncbi:MAG: carboxypeptidase-like regulatory domain-containing protein [Candidatus Sericytochromatia bacterium]|nr:carboxypeptidase-like regulatory domain-containing protein [Candidatus Sericytochromatia bacterium]
MSIQKVVLTTLMASLLAGCGGAANQVALPGDGTFGEDFGPAGDYAAGDDSLFPADDFGAVPTGDVAPVLTPAASEGVGLDPTASDTVTSGAGYVLRGVIQDPEGRPIAKAKVSIGSQTTLTNDVGEFVISGIMDTQVWVDVTADGFESISRYNIPFSAEKPLADKAFTLNIGESTGGNSPVSGPYLENEGTFGATRFKSVTAMAVANNQVYVLGKVSKFVMLERAVVVVYNATTGDEVSRFGDSVISRLPRSGTSLSVDGTNVVVADGRDRYTFDATGKFLRKAPGSAFEVADEVKDETNNLTYSLRSGTRVSVKGSGIDRVMDLDNVSSAKALGLTVRGTLLVLDSGAKVVHQFTLKP